MTIMTSAPVKYLKCLIFTAIAAGLCFAQGGQRLRGTLVVAVPVNEGLVACSDKRLYNDTTGQFQDDFVKIHKVGNDASFVATNTIGFLDKATGKMEFNVFDITSRYVSQHNFVPERAFWDGLKKDIHDQLLRYLSKRKYQDWPATDVANNRLLFNLVFFAISGNSARSYSMSVFYEKAPTPAIYIPNVVGEEVKTPKLLGKGKDVMGYLAKSPELSSDPSILRFDQSVFNIKTTRVLD